MVYVRNGFVYGKSVRRTGTDFEISANVALHRISH